MQRQPAPGDRSTLISLPLLDLWLYWLAPILPRTTYQLAPYGP